MDVESAATVHDQPWQLSRTVLGGVVRWPRFEWPELWEVEQPGIDAARTEIQRELRRLTPADGQE